MMKNKRGQIGIILFIAFLFLIVVVGFLAAMAVGIITYSSDIITPVMTDLGVVGGSNVSQAAEYTFGNLNTVTNALPWLVGFSYVAALVLSIIFSLSYTYNPHPVFIGLYIMLALLLVFGCIVMSNMYEDIYTGNDMMGDQLHEQTLMSYMILYSPFIMSLIAFITGIFLFTRGREEGFDV